MAKKRGGCVGHGSDRSDIKTKADVIGDTVDCIGCASYYLDEISRLEEAHFNKTELIKINKAIYKIEQRLFNMSAHIDARKNNRSSKFPTKL